MRVGVYAAADACAPVIRAAEHGGALACVTAARHLGLWVLDTSPVVHVWLGRDGREHHRSGCGCVAHWETGPRRGFAFPPLPRILWQLSRCQGTEAFFVALESALRQRLLTRSDLERLRTLVNVEAREAMTLARHDADSGLESLIRYRLRAHRLAVRTQVAVAGVGRVDLLIGDRLIVEVDGRVNHDGASLRHKDLVRDANAASWGYRTLRFDYAMVVHDWDLVERAILGSLASD